MPTEYQLGRAALRRAAETAWAPRQLPTMFMFQAPAQSTKWWRRLTEGAERDGAQRNGLAARRCEQELLRGAGSQGEHQHALLAQPAAAKGGVEAMSVRILEGKHCGRQGERKQRLPRHRAPRKAAAPPRSAPA